MPKTLFFKSCLGVFQGGGCRAAAFVGAYEQAVKSGVSFSEVAGTSAGSIIAAFVGAGAGPTELREMISNLDFQSFLRPPVRRASRNLLGRAFAWYSPKYADLFFDQGFYSSQAIRHWVNEQLSKLTPNAQHPLKFRSLQYPTYIVSTDITRSEAKIWSQQTTPDEAVADAVCASCAIPIFFQPIEGRHVDGGVLSNLPAFVFSARRNSERPLASRILAFTLMADEGGDNNWNAESFLRLLANAVVDGSQKLQLEIVRNVHVISIPTGDIKATDFDRMTSVETKRLMENGTNAAKAFFAAELINFRTPSDNDTACYGTDEMYTRLTESLEMAPQRIVISDHNTDWVYSLFPSLLCWRLKGIQVDALLPQFGDKEDGVYRRQLLRGLGVQVSEIENATEVPIRAFLVTADDPTQKRAIVALDKQPKIDVKASFYQGILDATVIEAVQSQIDAVAQFSDERLKVLPKLEIDSHDALFERLRSVRQYAKSSVRMAIEPVPVDRLISLTRFVREYKYRQIKHFVQAYDQCGVSLFDPAAVVLHKSKRSIVTPPVVEESGGRFVLVEGSTRATYCRDEGLKEIRCVVIRGAIEALPSKSLPFSHVRVVGRTLAANERYEDFDYNFFRKIERAVHPLESLN